MALHRYWNPTTGDHFYTTSLGELGPGGHGWTYEHIQCYVLPPTASLFAGQAARAGGEVPATFRAAPPTRVPAAGEPDQPETFTIAR